MELFNSIIFESDPKLYSSAALNFFKRKYITALDDDLYKKMRGLSVVVASQSQHMLRCIEIQMKNYKKKTTQSSWHNSSALLNLYNGLSELQTACAAFAIHGNIEIKTINYEGELTTWMMQTPPKTTGYMRYLSFQSKEVLKPKIQKGSTVEGEWVTLDSKELKRLLRKRRGEKYPENYSELVEKCQNAYTKLCDKLKLLQLLFI